MSFRFSQADTARGTLDCSRTSTHPPAGLCLPSAAVPAGVVQGLISRVRGGFPSLPHAACCSSPSPPPSRHQQRRRIRVRDDGGAALHCIRPASCHPSPGLREKKVRCNAMRGTFTTSTVMPLTLHAGQSNRRGKKQPGKGHTTTIWALKAWPSEQEKPAVIGQPIRICPAGNNIQKCLPTGLTRAPDYPSLQEREYLYPGTLSQPRELPWQAVTRLLLLLGTVSSKAPCDVSRPLHALLLKAATRADHGTNHLMAFDVGLIGSGCRAPEQGVLRCFAPRREKEVMMHSVPPAHVGGGGDAARGLLNWLRTPSLGCPAIYVDY